VRHVMQVAVAPMDPTRFAGVLRGRVVWNVNSTARGGGVADLFASLIEREHVS
jgi:hypothetical protein